MSGGALAGRLVLVTGSSRGIGAAVAAGLRREGATVVRAGRTLAAAPPAGEVHLAIDLATEDGPDRLADAVLGLGTPALVVSGAGDFSLGTVEDVPVAVLDRLYRVNLRAPYQLAHRLLPAMKAAGGGRHILIGSIADYVALPGNGAYAATKFGVRGLSEVLREEYRGSGVLCSLVSPGPVDTSLWDPIDPDRRDDLPSRARMLRPEDVAGAICWIAGLPAHVDIGLLQLGPA